MTIRQTAESPEVKFLVVAGDLVPTGGMDQANLALASYLERSGHVVSVVAHRFDRALAVPLKGTIHRVPKPLNSYLLGSPLLAISGRAVASRLAKQGGRVIVNGGNCHWPDVNWVHYVHGAYRPHSNVGLLGGKIAKLKGTGFRRSERRAFRLARMLIANSARTRDDIVEASGISPERIHVVYYGNDANKFRPSTIAERAALRATLGLVHDRKLFVFIGSLGDDRKGFETLFDAWKTVVRSREWQATLLVIGKGREEAFWRHHAQAELPNESIRFLGFRDDVPSILRASDVAVSPTRYEAFGLAVQEAICCGLPAIVTSSAGVAERITGQSRDLLINDPRDVTALAAQLVRVYDNELAFATAAESLARTIGRYSWDDMSRQIIQVISA